jgi:hypothetical protein
MIRICRRDEREEEEEEKFARKKINRNKSPQNNSNDDGGGDVGFVEALQKNSLLIISEMLSEKGTRAWNKLRNLYFMTH